MREIAGDRGKQIHDASLFVKSSPFTRVKLHFLFVACGTEPFRFNFSTEDVNFRARFRAYLHAEFRAKVGDDGCGGRDGEQRG